MIKHPMQQWFVPGALGGLVAGGVVALWFMLVDLALGQPFHTPAALARAMSAGTVSPTFQVIAGYSLVHFAVFALLGVCAAWVLGALALRPSIWLGMAFGIVVQECVFYAGLVLGGAPPSTIVAWPQVVGANLASGIALMATLDLAARREPLGLAWLRARPWIGRGVATGLIGAAAVACWFLILDIAAGQPFRTPNALGAALLFGATAGDVVPMSAGVIAAYTLVHVAAFVLAGILLVAAAEGVERTPAMVLIACLAAIVLEATVVTILALAAQWVLGVVGLWAIGVGNLLAVGTMGAYVWRHHPRLRYELRGAPLTVRL